MEASKTTKISSSSPSPSSSSGRNRNNLPLPWLNLMVTEPFYLFHLLILFSYFVARSSTNLSIDLSYRLFRREIQVVLMIAVLTVIKMVKEETWDAFIADILFYAKCFLLGVSLTIDYHLALYYLLAFTVIYILTQQPPYGGLGDSSHLTPLQLESLLTEGNTSRFWLVEFRALNSPACIRASSIFPELSITYSNKNISFGIIDLGHFPNAAEKFGISLNGQLPIFILFDSASEVARLPEISSELKAHTPTITKHLLCRHFELDRRLIEYISSK